MLYEAYMVTGCGTRTEGPQEIYFCNLLGPNDHAIHFNLVIRNCVGESSHRAIYNIIAPHIHICDLFNLEFAWQWSGNLLVLCIASLQLMEAVRLDNRERISTIDYLNPKRGYVAVAVPVKDSKTLHFPGLIYCRGDVFIHIDQNKFPETMPFSSVYPYAAPGRLVWKPAQGRIRRTWAKLFPARATS